MEARPISSTISLSVSIPFSSVIVMLTGSGPHLLRNPVDRPNRAAHTKCAGSARDCE